MVKRKWTRPGGSALAAARGALVRIYRNGLDFATRVYHKSAQDDIFFLAGGIAFNILLGAIPFLLLLISVFSLILRTAVDDPEGTVIRYVFSVLPPSYELKQKILDWMRAVTDEQTRFGVVGFILLVWISTRLIGSLRSALRFTFDIQEERGIIEGTIFDAKMVVVAGSLFVANTAITVLLEAVQTYGIELLGLRQGEAVKSLQVLYAQLLAYAFIFLMFVLIYRYLPARRIPWRIAVVSASFTTVVFELLKSAFAWYVAYAANFETTYGQIFATAVVLVFWVYYSAMVFILGGEVGQVYEMNRVRRKQRELLD